MERIFQFLKSKGRQNTTSEACLHHYLEKQVDKTPDAIAIVFEDQQITYKELDSQANRFAHFLNKRGIKKEIPVGILLERSIEMVIAVFGIFKSGGVYVPLDTGLPRDRLDHIATSANIPLILSSKEVILDDAPTISGIIYLEDIQNDLALASSDRLNISLNSENLAYIVFTSGSTGAPKGVMIPHRVFTRCKNWAQAYFRFSASDRFLLNFFRAPEELFYPLFIGAILYVSPKNAETNPALLALTLKRHQISVAGLTPSLLNSLLSEPNFSECTNLKHVYCAGEALPIEFQKRFHSKLSAQLYNFYGLAEAPFSLIWRCIPGDQQQTIPIGRPVDATIKILDKTLEPADAETPGALYIAGPGLARGYLNGPKQTAERFININGIRYYNTGDQVYLNKTGHLIFSGRADHQVQIRGLRVEPREIEAALLKFPSIQEAVVLFENNRLVAHISSVNARSINSGELVDFLNKIIPDYMIPSAFVLHDTLPKSVTGKIDRQNLPTPGRQRLTDLRSSEKKKIQSPDKLNVSKDYYPCLKTIHELFEEQVQRIPDALAAADRNSKLSYRELNKKANQLAHYLQKQGIEKGKPIGICLGRSLEMIIAILGTLKSGAAYVPLDPEHPQSQLEYISRNAQFPILITQSHLVEKLPFTDVKTIRIDIEQATIDHESSANPIPSSSPGDLAYIIYTSGSTGNPKGVAIEHRNTTALLKWAKSVYDANEMKGVLAATSYCFDLSIFEMFAPITSGGAMIIVENIFDLSRADLPITLINTVPTAIKEILDSHEIPDTVVTVNLAGEPLSPIIVNKLYENPGIRKVYDLYGPSETTTYSTFALRRPQGPNTIGKPIDCTSILILDSELNEVSKGKTGEIYIGGAGVARGYFNNPDLSSQRFLSNPFGSGRLYKTGDLARHLPNGDLEYKGRIDHQIKLRGFRIELGEIEAAIGRFPGVNQCVAIVLHESDPSKNKLVAYIVSENNLDQSTLRNSLKEWLPSYMIPSSFVAIDRIPLTPNGKTDRNALAALPNRIGDNNTPVAPQDETQATLCRIWAEVMNSEDIGIDDDFFALGGHSIIAMQILNRIKTEFSVDIPFRTLFEKPNIQQLSQEIIEILNERGAPI